MVKSSFEEELSRNGKLIYTNVGDSMAPLIREGRDLVVIEPVCGRLKKYDVPLYRRDSGQYVLHRIVKVRAEDYVLCGDNRIRRETGITDRHILGRLTAVIRQGKTVPVSSFRLRLYALAVCALYPLRFVFRKIKSALRRLIRKGRDHEQT